MTHDIASDIEDPEDRYTVRSAVLREIQRRQRDAEKAKEGTKRCPSCKMTKARTDFAKNAARPGGLQSTCKECQRKR